jgi:hypothetical protein
MIPNDESVVSATNRINQYLEEELIEAEAEQDNE